MDFYYLPASPPCHAVLLTAKSLGLDLNKIVMDMRNGEHRKPEYLKINPQHTVPTLVDGDFKIWESRAIMTYLVEAYGKKHNSLYPCCPKTRACINQRLYFDMTLYQHLADYFYPKVFEKKPVVPEALKKLEEALEFLNIFLEGQKYAVGDTMTLADLALLATVSPIDISKFVDLSKYPNVGRWYENMKNTAPGADEHWNGVKEWAIYCNLTK